MDSVFPIFPFHRVIRASPRSHEGLQLWSTTATPQTLSRWVWGPKKCSSSQQANQVLKPCFKAPRSSWALPKKRAKIKSRSIPGVLKTGCFEGRFHFNDGCSDAMIMLHSCHTAYFKNERPNKALPYTHPLANKEKGLKGTKSPPLRNLPSPTRRPPVTVSTPTNFVRWVFKENEPCPSLCRFYRETHKWKGVVLFRNWSKIPNNLENLSKPTLSLCLSCFAVDLSQILHPSTHSSKRVR